MKVKPVLLYALLILPMLIGVALLLLAGRTLEGTIATPSTVAVYNMVAVFSAAVRHPLPTMLLQIVVILAAAKGLGRIFKQIGQQAVMGEITAGILLGPSLLGWLSPHLFNHLFPTDSLGHLQLLSQLGLLLFMFVIGMELDVDMLRSRLGESLLISHSSIVFPYLLGVAFAYWSYNTFAPAHTTFIEYALFMGIAMSITAFPVLARILKERGMTTTPIGSMAIICAAINDVTAWCILPIVVAIAKAESMIGVLVTILLTLSYLAVMIFWLKPSLEYLNIRWAQDGAKSKAFVSVAILTLLISAFVAEVIGIHALFGAFIAGAVMPSSQSIKKVLTDRLEDVSLNMLMPVFFALTGLRTNIGSLTEGNLWLICGVIIALAISGKLLGSAIAAHLTGMSWRESLSIGALMNTRGLMELIVLNIGYDLGILRQDIFTMLVFMALITTFMTAPLLNIIERVKLTSAE